MTFVSKYFYLAIAYLFLLFALIGVVLPGIPTVPFLLVSAWAAAKGSKKLHDWIYQHKVFGPLLTDWEREGAISRKSKIIGILLLIVSWTILFFQHSNMKFVMFMALMFCIGAVFLWSRPEPQRLSDSEN